MCILFLCLYGKGKKKSHIRGECGFMLLKPGWIKLLEQLHQMDKHLHKFHNPYIHLG